MAQRRPWECPSSSGSRSLRRTIARFVAVALVALVCVVFVLPSALAADADGAESSDSLGEPWVGSTDDGDEVIEFYFVFSSTCPHCRAALPFVQQLQKEREWLRVWWIQTDIDDDRGREIAVSVSQELGEPIRAVPTFMFCDRMQSGFDTADGIGAQLAAELDACRAAVTTQQAVTTTTEAVAVAVPGVGDIKASVVPLPVFTVLVAGLDAFNPCAFFVLLFLLSLLVHARNRMRMALIGGVFVAVSGVLYFVFMAAWLNLFLVTDNIRWVTVAAGALAVGLGAISAKDAFAPESGLSTSIPASAKPGLYSRARGIVHAESLVPVLGATIGLAVVANSYELLCTAGLPMAFTRVLTLNDLPTPAYYGYLALYNVVYVVPLLAIVAGFVWTLGSRKLQPNEGRALKLLSGSMMLGLGAVLLVAPQLLERVGTAVIVVGVSVAVTLVAITVNRLVDRSGHRVSSKPPSVRSQQ